jgi:hypothetical protein
MRALLARQPKIGREEHLSIENRQDALRPAHLFPLLLACGDHPRFGIPYRACPWPAFTSSFKAHLFRNKENRMRHIRRRQFRRRPRRFRFRTRGFSDRFAGPIYRGAFKLLGVPPEGRRSAYNALAIAIVVIVAIGFGISSLGSEEVGAGISALVVSLVIGGIVVTAFRFFR